MAITYSALIPEFATTWHDGSGEITYSYLGSVVPDYYPESGFVYTIVDDVFEPVTIPVTATSVALSTAMRTLTTTAIKAWNDVAMVNMVAGTAEGSTFGDITFGQYGFTDYEGDPDQNLYGFVADFPPFFTPSEASPHGDVWINSSNPSQNVAQYGHTSYNTILHEMGHALGLSHPNDDPSNDANEANNNNQYTVMSYEPHPGVAADDIDDQGFPLTPMILDIQAIQALYGVNTATRRTDTTYFGDGDGTGSLAFQYGDNAMQIYGRPVILTIWDAGGVDHVDASDLTSASRIDLRPGLFSTIGSLSNNVAMAAAVTVSGKVINLIEHATGGTGNDKLTGNDGDNRLMGKNGNDAVYGGDGADTLIGGLGNDTVYGGTGTDTAMYLGTLDAHVVLSETARQNTGYGYDVLSGVQNLQSSDGDDYLQGSDSANRLTGGAAVDRLFGRGGDDRLFGGSGVDSLSGGVGDDSLMGGTGADKFVFYSGGGKDRVYDFTNGTDRIEITSGATRYEDLTISDGGTTVVIAFGTVTITLVDTDRGDIGRSDFLFS